MVVCQIVSGGHEPIGVLGVHTADFLCRSLDIFVQGAGGDFARDGARIPNVVLVFVRFGLSHIVLLAEFTYGDLGTASLAKLSACRCGLPQGVLRISF